MTGNCGDGESKEGYKAKSPTKVILPSVKAIYDRSGLSSSRPYLCLRRGTIYRPFTFDAILAYPNPVLLARFGVAKNFKKSLALELPLRLTVLSLGLTDRTALTILDTLVQCLRTFKLYSVPRHAYKINWMIFSEFQRFYKNNIHVLAIGPSIASGLIYRSMMALCCVLQIYQFDECVY